MATSEESAASLSTSASAAFQQVWSTQVDGQTAQQLGGLVQVRQARLNLLQRTVTQLSASQGAKSTDVVALQQTIAAQQWITTVLSVVRDQSATPAPTVPANGWVVYGTVRDPNLQPAPMLTVSLVNEQKEWLRDYGYAFTDTSGSFSLSFAPPSKNEAGANAGASCTPTASVYLQVADEKRRPVYFDTTAFTLAVGSAVYRNIALPTDSFLGIPPAGAETAVPASAQAAASSPPTQAK